MGWWWGEGTPSADKFCDCFLKLVCANVNIYKMLSTKECLHRFQKTKTTIFRQIFQEALSKTLLPVSLQPSLQPGSYKLHYEINQISHEKVALHVSHIKCVYQKSTKFATYKSLSPLEVMPHPAAWLKMLVFRVKSFKLTAKINRKIGNKVQVLIINKIPSKLEVAPLYAKC